MMYPFYNINIGVEHEWPWNLIAAIQQAGDGEDLFEFDSAAVIPADFMGTLMYVLHTLTPREYMVILMRFSEGETYEQVGKHFNVTRERIRQIEAKAIRKLRNPARREFIRDGVSGRMEELKESISALREENIRLTEQLNKALESNTVEEFPAENSKLNTLMINMDLSVRTFNCIARHMRMQYNKPYDEITAADILLLDVNELIKIRDFGRKSLKELTDKMHELLGEEYKWFPKGREEMYR